VALDLLRRHDDPGAVLAAAREQRAALIFDLGRIAVLLVAAALGGVIRHVAGGVEFLVQLNVLRRMAMLLSRRGERDAQKGKHENQSKSRHDEPPSKDGASAVGLKFGGTTKLPSATPR